MSTLQNKDVVHRFFDEIQKGNLEIANELVAESASFHVAGRATVTGPESQKRWASMLWEAFPGACIGLDDIVAEADKVVVRWTFSGTHRGPFQGLPPTNRQITIGGIGIYRIENGTIVEGWSNYDMLGALEQLGMIPGRWQT